MGRLRVIPLIIGSCLAVVALPFLRQMFAVLMCGILVGQSSLCSAWVGGYHWGDRAQAALPPTASVEAVPRDHTDRPQLAAPPLIRQPGIDLEGIFPSDLMVVRQTPYRTGRNQILIVSPSTGLEQRFEITLPGSGDFRVFQSRYSQVSIPDSSRVVRDGRSLTPSQIENKLDNFAIDYGPGNTPTGVVLADNTRAEISDVAVVVRSAAGQVLETVPLPSSLLQPDATDLALKADFLAQADSNCERRTLNIIYDISRGLGRRSDVLLRQAQSDEGKLMAWVLAFGKRSFEDSLVADRRNQTLQEIACRPPVQCDQAQDYSGGSEVRTDLFQLPSSPNAVITLRYEFYQIPDRLELYYEGTQIFDTGFASGSGTRRITNVPSGGGYLGVKVTGNESRGTLWNYTISCSGSG